MRRRSGAPLLGLLILTSACMPASSGSARPQPPPDTGSDTAGLVPAGFGTLRQDDITVTLRADDLQVRVTPLTEGIVRLTAPDTYRRLASTRDRLESNRLEQRLPVLVSFFTETPGGAELEPRDLTLVSRGRRYHPEHIEGLTAGWGQGRVEQGRPAQAVYLFSDAVDLEMELVVEFGPASSSAWHSIVPRLETERARVRARAGSGARNPSSRPDRTS